MKISEHVSVLALEANLMMGRGVLNVALIHDPVHGATLVDTGTPNLLPTIEAALQQEGVQLSDIKRVIVTHHDLDHIGSLEAVVKATGAEVLTSELEIPYVQEGKRAQKMPPADKVDEVMGHLPEPVREMVKNMPGVHVKVDRVLQDGEVLDIAGGVRVVFTPGHTVGHLSLYVEQDGVLISGDALTSADGELKGPSAQNTPDMPEAIKSVQKLAQLPAQKVLTYHGGVVDQDAALQLNRVAAVIETA
ncbi:MBL fold metallo-hydrolase [Deinococcus ruber]|uniref:Hydrolase n=1 Tax=Deinococcus ruber TaxID=1848197 RepID=A0A918BWD4_9DEIO|nr:MBL fold metallo-hydrolase [Deinococcus ruber]GGQ94199.1 hydrolase [Deinococcus ruber]